VKLHHCDQRSDEWRLLRCGKLTASCVGDAFATIKSGYAASRRNLILKLTLERLTGKPQESGFVSPDMERGTLLEPEAVGAYEAETGHLVSPVGFVEHDELLTGASPDGLPEGGYVEIKCPKAATHLDYLRGGLPIGYRLQMIHGLWLTGRTWADFVSYHPDFPEPLRLKVTRLWAKDLDFAAHELNVRTFLSECEREVNEVRALMGEGVAV
jgi:hypothetical protein